MKYLTILLFFLCGCEIYPDSGFIVTDKGICNGCSVKYVYKVSGISESVFSDSSWNVGDTLKFYNK